MAGVTELLSEFGAIGAPLAPHEIRNISEKNEYHLMIKIPPSERFASKLAQGQCRRKIFARQQSSLQ